MSDCYTGGDCGGGLAIYALNYVRDYGISDEACYPYTAVDSSCSSRCADYASRLTRIPNNNYTYTYTNEDIKNLISSYGPVAISLAIGSDKGGYFDGSGVYRCTTMSAAAARAARTTPSWRSGMTTPGATISSRTAGAPPGMGMATSSLVMMSATWRTASIGWIVSSLPVFYDHFTYMPALRTGPQPGAGLLQQDQPRERCRRCRNRPHPRLG